MANFNIIGSDGQQYGPISSETLRQWISENRVGAQTQVLMEGVTEWQVLSQIPEFAGAFGQRTTPPPLSAIAPQSAAAKTSGLAITSLVLGILGFFTCGITALFGLITGIIAVVKISKSGGALRGKGFALTGTILSAILLLMIPIGAAMVLPALAKAKQQMQTITQGVSKQIACVNNEKQLSLALRVYSGDHTNHFPPAATWCDAIMTNVGSEQIFKCPAGIGTNRCDYAFNSKLDGMDADKINPRTVAIFESDAGWNANGGSELMIKKPRHIQMMIVAFADGSVQQLPASQLKTLRWDP